MVQFCGTGKTNSNNLLFSLQAVLVSKFESSSPHLQTIAQLCCGLCVTSHLVTPWNEKIPAFFTLLSACGGVVFSPRLAFFCNTNPFMQACWWRRINRQNSIPVTLTPHTTFIGGSSIQHWKPYQPDIFSYWLHYFLFICLSVYPSIYQSLRVPIHLSVYSSIYRSLRVPIHLSISACAHPSINLCVCPSISPSTHPSIYLSALSFAPTLKN